jgi:hypothetical protein
VFPPVVGKNGTATFVVAANTPVAEPMVVNYGLSGNAAFGNDYVVSGDVGQAVIPAGESFAIVTLTVVTPKTKGREKVTMTLGPGAGYNLPKAPKGRKIKIPKVTVTIQNR